MPRSSLPFVVLAILVTGLTVGCSPSYPTATGAASGQVQAVAPASDPTAPLREACEPVDSPSPSFSDFQACYSHQLEEILARQGATLSMLTLYQLADASKRFGNLCHATAHHISEIMFKRVGSVTEAMALCREGCAFGCQHAVLTAYFRSLPSGAKPDLNRLCPQNPQHLFSLSHAHCTHGVGHGLAHYWNDTHRALAVCEQFPLAWEQRFCTKGVFMEESIKIASTEPSSQNPNRYLDLCRAVEARFRNDCYYYLIQLVSWSSNGATYPMFSACESVAEPNRKACYLGIGRAIGGDHVDREDELIQLCRAYGGDYAAYCMLGFAEVVASFIDSDRGFRFCEKLPEDVRLRCARDVGIAIRLRWAAEDKISAECVKAGTARYVDACLDVRFTSGDLSTQVP